MYRLGLVSNFMQPSGEFFSVYCIGSDSMGQRLASATPEAVRSQKNTEILLESALSIFPTGLGWFGLWGHENLLSGLVIGHASEEEVHSRVRALIVSTMPAALNVCDWNPELRRRLEKFASGIRIEFDDCEIELDGMTSFQKKVVAATRKVRYGSTVSYGELARKAGSPGAARAVGSVMSGNRFPIIVPCHRVLASGSRIGGFSAPQGISLKVRMLELESIAEAAVPSSRQNARQFR